MFRARLLAAALAFASLSFASGCITLFSKTEVVRGEETPVRPSFESPQAEDTFRTVVKSKSKSVGGTHVGVPFNDCVLRCDTNQDGLITLAEAKGFEKMEK
jgi:hypothetical protein